MADRLGDFHCLVGYFLCRGLKPFGPRRVIQRKIRSFGNRKREGPCGPAISRLFFQTDKCRPRLASFPSPVRCASERE